jgi:FkbH-like protein
VEKPTTSDEVELKRTGIRLPAMELLVQESGEQHGSESSVMNTDGSRASANSSPTAYRLAVAATFTVEPIEDALAYWMEELGVACTINFAPYNQVFQQLLDPGSQLAQNREGCNVVLVRIEDWLRFSAQPANPETLPGHLTQHATDLTDAVRTALVRSSTSMVLVFCPVSAQAAANPVVRNEIARVEEQITSDLAGTSGLYLIGRSDFRAYPIAAYDDPERDQLGHIPYTSLFFATLATVLARRIHALLSPPHKVVVLDCDNTLWQGVVAEEGTAGIAIPPAFRQLQHFMVELSAKGFLLCLCSKNEESDVLAVFDQRPDMVLKQEHVVSWRINWQPKSENIRSLAQELNLGLDSFIFLDDNPVECAQLRAECPEVLTLQLPSETEVAGFLENVWAFDRFRVTAEDQQRTAMYQQEAERGRFQKQALTIEDFFAGLNLQVMISEPAPAQLLRIAQLTQRTNQFNFKTIRRRDAEIGQLAASGLECRAVSVSDRFGDYGLVGVMIFGDCGDTLEIDTFLLSCRVLGRGVEHQMMRMLGELCRERRLSHVVATLISTPKNIPAHRFLEEIAVGCRAAIDGGSRYHIPVELAANLVYRPQAAEPEHESAATEKPPSRVDQSTRVAAKWPRFERIATVLSSPEQVLQATHAHSRHRRLKIRQDAPSVAPRTELEKALADVWAEVLRLDVVGIRESFFELGGTSLRAVDLFAQIERRFGKKLPLTTLIEAPTIEQLAALLAEARDRDSLVLIRDGSGKPPLFLVHDGDGETLLYRNLAHRLRPEHAVFGLEPRSQGDTPIVQTRITDMAAHHIDRMRSVQPQGPYLVGGMCAGGVIAFEIARQLQLRGDKVALVALLDAADVAAQLKPWRFAAQRIRSFSVMLHQDQPVRFDRRILALLAKALRKARNFSAYVLGERFKNIRDELRMRLFRMYLDRRHPLPWALQQIPVRTVYLFAEKGYRPDGPFDGRLVLFRATRGEGSDEPYVDRYTDPLLGWDQRATQGVRVYDVPGGHSSMLQEPYVETLAEQLQISIDEAISAEPRPLLRQSCIVSESQRTEPVGARV